MANDAPAHSSPVLRLQRGIDQTRDHVRGTLARGSVSVVVYGDFLCPYCRRFRQVMQRLREALGERLVYVFRHFPSERAHPGADFMSRAAEAAARQGRFWDMYDRLYTAEPPISEADVFAFGYELDLDMAQFQRDLESEDVREHVALDLLEGRRNGVTGTPTFFLDGLRYDGAWDFYSMLEALERPVAARVDRSARVFASLPAAGGLVLIVAAALALILANSPLAPLYRVFTETSFSIGFPNLRLSLPIAEWCSEGLLAVFFLLVGLEIRREMTTGALSDKRAAILPVLAAVGGCVVPALIYLTINMGTTSPGWSVPTATDIAFTLGILALLGDRVSPGLRVFVAALAVVDDILSVLTLAIFYPRNFDAMWLLPAAAAAGVMFLLNRSRVYAGWPYAVTAVGLWLSLHGAGVHGALAGVVLAAFIPTRPAPAAGPLLAQAATALAALESAENDAEHEGERRRISQAPVWDWAGRNLSAASERLLSPADRLERAVSPWSTYIILPLFAFSATGVSFNVDLGNMSAQRILFGVIAGLVLGKPLGIALACLAAIKLKLAIVPDGVTLRSFIGAACLCGVGYTVALLMADQAFADETLSAVAKIGVLIGSTLAAVVGALVFLASRAEPAQSE